MLALCIASRGRPESLLKVITAMDDRAVLPSTQIIVALDDDDPTRPHFAPLTDHELIWSVGPREDSLGAKYNRCRSLTQADVCMFFCDDGEIVNEGWDSVVASYAQMFPDGVGMVEAGNGAGDLPCSIAVTRGMSDRLGYFMPPYFPTWFHETWMNEIGLMTGRLIRISDLEYSEYSGRKTQSLKDVSFWAEFFDETRPMREKQAEELAQRLEAPFRLHQIRQMIPEYRKYFAQRNSILRGDQAARIEASFTLNDLDEDRHLRLKKKAGLVLA